jgi:hypothetical protein
MSPDVDTAKDLLQLAGGPSVLGVGALLTYTSSTFTDSRRIASKGWLALGAGSALLCWLLLFLVLSAPTVWASLTARGPVEPILVLLAAAWVISAALVLVVSWKAPIALRYLIESYRSDETPWMLRWLRRWLG